LNEPKLEQEIVCHVLCFNNHDATQIAETLVVRDLCEHVQILPGSKIMKKGDSKTRYHDRNTLCIIKTTRDKFLSIIREVRQIIPDQQTDVIVAKQLNIEGNKSFREATQAKELVSKWLIKRNLA
jgi:uncharacterized protein involved in tolerance to divalent cations